MDEETLSLFSDFCEEFGVRLYSKDEDEEDDEKGKKRKKKKVYLEDVNSHRGLGRSIILGAAIPGAVGGFVGKKKADEADREGKSDREIKEIAGKTGAKTGALVGGALGLANTLSGAAKSPKGYVGRSIAYGLASTAGLGGFGALGGYLGARKNTSRRLEKRAAEERKREQD